MTNAIRKGYVDTPGGQIHYREAGQGSQPLVLLHQSPSASGMWNAVLQPLAKHGIHAIALDMPGFGNSFAPESEPGLAWYARSIDDAIEALGFPKADVLGHHTGASVAMQLAVDSPDRVRRLVLWGIPLLPPERLERLATEAEPTYSADGSEIARYLQNRQKMSGHLTGIDVHIRCTIEMLQTGQHRPWGHRAVGKTDHEALLAQIQQPTFALAGDREGLRDVTEDGAKRLAHGEYYNFADAGLDVADEFPDELARVVADWLKRA